MGSNLFFPANRQRYDRVTGLSNNIESAKGQSAQIYDQLKTEAEHLDTLCKDLMTKHGAKTLKEYAEVIANTLPTAERDRVLHLLKTLEDADVFLTNASSVLTAVLATAGGTRLVSSSAKVLIEILSEGMFRAEFARGFRLFVSGSVKEGTRVMRGVTKWARNHYEFLGELAPAARSARAIRVLRVFNTVLEFIAKWAFILDLVVLFIQYQIEEQQRTELRGAIHDFFCQRFSVQMQFDQFKVTQALYTQLRGFVQTKTILDASPTQEGQKVIETLGDAFMNTYDGDMAKITDDSVWAECAVYDANAWKDEDPDKAEVSRWMEEQSKKDPEEIKDQDNH